MTNIKELKEKNKAIKIVVRDKDNNTYNALLLELTEKHLIIGWDDARLRLSWDEIIIEMS